jgi:hypothetical protein
MALQSSGEIRASQIRAEFGDSGRSRGYGNGSVSFGAYRDVNQEVTGQSGTDAGRNFTLDHDFVNDRSYIPRPKIDNTPDFEGPIRFSHFYDAKLNVVLAYGNPDNPSTPGQHARQEKYFGRTKVIGGFRDKPTENDEIKGSKIILYVNKKLGSPKGDQTNCALRTGSWPSGTEIHIEVSPNGKILGGGGDGGSGGDNTEDGNKGKNGSSAIELQSYVKTVRVRSGGIIAPGGGGGGGGGGAKGDKGGDKGGGGGGGGGAGFPNSEGGRGGSSNVDGSPGNDGNDTTVGIGGNGGSQSSAQGGNGGNGGGLASNGQGGTSGDASGGGNDTGNGADGGEPGYRYVRKTGVNAPLLTIAEGTGSISGSDKLDSSAANRNDYDFNFL